MKSTQKMGILNSILYIIFSITFCFYKYGDAAKNILIPGDELNSLDSTSILLSPSGSFTLGFFAFSSTNLTYLGIWYTNEKEKQKIWVSNRDIPFVGYGVLRMDASGNLNVVNGTDGTTFFNVSNNQVVVSGNNTRAMLEDSGNFVVYDINKNGNQTLWQSFDHPTDTLVPGMKLGYNLTSKRNWKLTSWADQDAPALGAFTLRLEQYQNSPQLLIYRREVLYWASGPWENGIFRFLPSYRNPGGGYPFDLIYDTSGMYITVQDVSFGSSTLRRFSSDGQFATQADTSFGALSTLLQLSSEGRFSDKGNSFSATPSFCFGGDDYWLGRGCVVSAFPYCRAPDSNYEWSNLYYISGPANTYDANSNISLGDCMERCWNDCTCTGCMTDISGTGCLTWTDKPKKGDNSGRVYVISYPKRRIWRMVLFYTAILLTCAFTTLLCYVRIKMRLHKGKENKRRRDIIQQLTGSNSFNYGDELERGIQDAPDVKIFSLKAVLAATNNFSNDNKLGQGGYGPVYKGELSDGRKIAIKRLSKASGQGILEFKSELILISKLQHTNLVRLYGCCIHQEERMLIYEFMPNKSLDFFLFGDADKNKTIDWRTRFKIIEGIAQGLLYLHKYSRMRVIHRDLKASNVLLDVNMNPKIADFGMARIFQQDMSEANTKRVVGTYGYMAPEYTMHGTFSFKSDVFSFGVLILEIVSGKKNSSFHSLLRYAWELWRRDATLELKDEALGESYDVKQILRAIHIGLLCVQQNANNRATMSEVISMLNNEIADLPILKQPAFFVHPDEFQPSRSTEHSSGGNIQGSVNGLTITTMEAI